MVAEIQLVYIPPKQGDRLKTTSLAKVQGEPRDYVQRTKLLMMVPGRKWEAKRAKEGEEKAGKIKENKTGLLKNEKS